MPIESTWDRREVVLLEAIARGEAEHDDDVQNDELEERTSLSDEDVEWGLKALVEAEPPYITGTDASSGGEFCVLLGIRLAERGRREVGQWPDETVGPALMALLDQRIESEPDGEQKTRLQRFRESARTVGIDVLTQLIVAASRQAAGF